MQGTVVNCLSSTGKRPTGQWSHTSKMGLLVEVAIDHNILLSLTRVDYNNHGRAALFLVHIVRKARDFLFVQGDTHT